MKVAITGASGFIGGHLLRVLARRGGCETRALRYKSPYDSSIENAHWVSGDIRNPAIWDDLLEGCESLVHLVGVHSESSAADADLKDLVDACVKWKVGRIVYCSTAVVVGDCGTSRVTETTPCRPVDSYQTYKLRQEIALRRFCADRVALSILRPTAVFGPGGKNLLKLARDLSQGGKLENWLRSCVFGKRRMNLVAVENVAAALEFLACDSTAGSDGIFICSQDHDPDNNFRFVERRLLERLNIGSPSLPSFPLPSQCLRFLHRVTGKTGNDPCRIYDSTRLRSLGFRMVVDFPDALDAFANWYRTQGPQDGRSP